MEGDWGGGGEAGGVGGLGPQPLPPSMAHFSPPPLAPGFGGRVLNGGCPPPS